LPRPGFSGDNLPFSSFSSDYSSLPTVSFVIPNLIDDMHSASIEQGDAWLKTHLAPTIEWAMSHHALVVLTWDEDDGSAANHIPTLFIGQDVKPGRYGMTVTHESVLRTIETLYGLKSGGNRRWRRRENDCLTALKFQNCNFATAWARRLLSGAW
jgi:acid phosphatase